MQRWLAQSTCSHESTNGGFTTVLNVGRHALWRNAPGDGCRDQRWRYHHRTGQKQYLAHVRA